MRLARAVPVEREAEVEREAHVERVAENGGELLKSGADRLGE
jgi:hypothetical protein